ncbi:MAG TPA: hypothetical protein VM818_24675 [Vicinamibacterales bacterium]|nr:hypothetical protein [Vicinamibacterales bacterium]
MKPACAACLFVLCAGASLNAQIPPAEPIVLAGGRLTVGGNVSATFGPEDPGFFNYTDYEDSVLRMLRLDLNASFRANDHLSLLGELRSQNVRAPQAYALYLRVRPWTTRRFDIQVGRIPPTFGSFARRSYEADNPLIGYPLGYQYLTSLRADAVPSSADELVNMRGRGWLAAYSVGNPVPDAGVPLATAFRWDTGVQAHLENEVVDLTASITTGTLSNPRLTDDNSGRQVTGRVALRPVAGLIVGASAAHGPFVSTDAVLDAVGSEGDDSFAQTAWGGDIEYSRGYYLLRVESIYSQWRMPLLEERLHSLATLVEGRYKIFPGFYVAARLDHLDFSEVASSSGPVEWEAPVTRFEVGGGYSVQRNLLLKLTTQFDRRDGGRTRHARMLAGQVVYWF